MGIGKPHILRSLVHQLDKLCLAPRNEFRRRNACIISGGHCYTLDDGFQALNLPLLQKDLGTSHGFGIGAGNYLTLKLHSSCT